MEVESSPEFEFWMIRNPSLPSSNLLTADELFLDGVLRPLQLLSLSPSQPPSLEISPRIEPPPTPSSILLSSFVSSSSISRRWKDLFKVGTEKKQCEKDNEKMQRKKGRKSSSDLNINLNIWPFTRSQSTGGRPRSAGFVPGRKVRSAPCSRSNSSGDSGVGRSGLHLGRSIPVCRFRRAGPGSRQKGRIWANTTSAAGANTAGVRVLNLNVNSCIGYGERVSLRGDDSDGTIIGDRIVEGNVANESVTSVFSLKALFAKKVY